MKTKQLILTLAIIAALFGLTGCGNTSGSLTDGYFTAEMQEYNNGWKEFVTIYIRDGAILTVEYNAKNASGFIKSWDMAYMRNMNGLRGTYPNRYTREYARSLLQTQSPDNIDIVAGASSSGGSFQKLAAAALEQSLSGNHDVIIVDTTK